MLGTYFCPRVIARLRAGLDFKILKSFLFYLHRRGHHRGMVQRYVREAEIFLRSLRLRRIPLSFLSEGDVRAFACRPKCRQRPRSDCHAALRHLIRHLRKRGLIPAKGSSFPKHIQQVVAAFDGYLRDVAGLASATRLYRRRYAAEFIQSVSGAKPIRWSQVRPAHVRAFFAEYSRTGHGAAARVASGSLRSFFNWLQFKGIVDRDLKVAVPFFRQWRHATLPSFLSDDQYHAFLATFKGTTALGRRDYALAVCMGDLGLRASEVANLLIDDVDERAATIQIAAGKTRRGRVLPLPKRVRQAILAYIRSGRPISVDPRLFLRHRTPSGVGVSRELVRGIIRRAFAQVVGCEHQTGTHILRHTAATRLHRAGADIKPQRNTHGAHWINDLTIPAY